MRDILARVKVRPEAVAVMVHGEQGYTTNIPLAELRADDVLLALEPQCGARSAWPLTV